MLALFAYFKEKYCSLHDSANVVSGECKAGGVRKYYKFLTYANFPLKKPDNN